MSEPKGKEAHSVEVSSSSSAFSPSVRSSSLTTEPSIDIEDSIEENRSNELREEVGTDEDVLEPSLGDDAPAVDWAA